MSGALVYNPSSRIRRSIFPTLSHGVCNAFNSGSLVPIGTPIEVLPGDYFHELGIKSFIRMMPTVYVPLNNIYCYCWYFYVPSRILWTHWKEFVGENTNDPWTSTTTYRVPRISMAPSGTYLSTGNNTILSHFGVRKVAITDPSSASPSSASWINALPVRAYCMIWNEYFRDTNYQYPILYQKGDNDVNYSTGTLSNWQDAAVGNSLLPLDRIPDYFSTGIPDPQFDTTPVRLPVNPKIGGSTSTENYVWRFINTSTGYITNKGIYTTGGGDVQAYPITSSGSDYLTALPNNALGTYEEFRIGYLTSQYKMALGMFGTRYQDIVNSLFGVEPSNGLVDRPLLLGFHKFNISISPVVQTSATETVQYEGDEVNEIKGSVSGYSATRSDAPYMFKGRFKEHGYILPLVGIRIERSYSQGLHKLWRKSTFLDFYNRFFNDLGPQPTYTWQLFCGLTTNGSITVPIGSVWNYNEAWLEYKLGYNQITGIMSDTDFRKYWTLCDIYDNTPTLSATWLAEDPSNLNRTLAVAAGSFSPTASGAQFLGDFYINIVVERSMSQHSYPGLGVYL